MRRTLVIGISLAICITGLGWAGQASASDPADAGDSHLLTIQPVTWVAGGWQYVATRTTADPAGSLGITRSPNDGWSPTGRLVTTLAAPSTGLLLENVVAATDDGKLTTTWRPTSCLADALCDRWFARFDATGTPIGSPVQVPQAARPVRPLSDGSLLTRSPDGALGWRGPDGVDRGAPDVAEAVVHGAAVDTDGRLLLTLTGATATRWPVGGPADLTFGTGCAAGQLSAIGPAPDGGFATACQAGEPTAFVVTRRSATGAQVWQSVGTTDWTATCCDGPVNFAYPRFVVVDSLDRVWVAGKAESSGDLGVGPGALVASFTADGPGPIADELLDFAQGADHRYTDLRLASPDHVAFASVAACCPSTEFPQPFDEQVSWGIVPLPPAAPTCRPGLILTAADEDSVTGTVQPCRSPAIGREPTGYRIVATGSAGEVLGSTEVDPGTSTESQPFAAPVTAGGQLLHIDVVPFNVFGDGSSGSRWTTVAPFTSVSAFVNQQYSDLTDAGLPGTILYTELTDGTVTPRSVVVDLLSSGYARADVEPVARLYRAFFLRDADPSGLRYWVRQHQAGRSLSRIAGEFAASSEFRRRYGPLSDAAFVARLYQNVFGREADPSGAAFWTRRLQTKRATRGSVVLAFSESSESLRRTASTVPPLAAAYLLLGRLPTAAERAAWAAAPDPREAAVAAILASAEYADRIAALEP